jgi:hypothetical protein
MVIESLFVLLLGLAALLATALAAVLTVRRRSSSPHLLMTAGLLGTVFFASLPDAHPAYAGVALLLAVVGFILAPDVGIAPPDELELGESSAIRRTRRR